MLQAGITGGIGSGKSTVCRIFEVLGIPVYYADERAKWLMENKHSLIEGIIRLFGKKTYTRPGQLNRKHLAAVVFEDEKKLKQLNALVHPAVWEDGQQWVRQQKNVPYTLREAALIFESGSFRQLDKVIVVTAPEELRIQRVMRRDKVERAEVEARIRKQMPEEEKVKRADFVIVNDGSSSLIRQVLEIHFQLLDLAGDFDS